MRRLPALLISLMVLLFGAQCAWGFDPEQDIQVVFKKGAVVLTAPQGSHLKASFMEIVLKKGLSGTLKVGPMPPTREKDELGEGIWHDRVAIPVAGDGLKGDVELVVTYQPCTEGQGGACYPPTDRILKVKASEIPPVAGEKAAAAPAQVPANPSAAVAAEPPMAPVPAVQPVPPAKAPQAPQGLFLVFLGIFVAGFMASLTPCVFPMIPITMAIIGAKGGGKAKGFGLSLMLVLGIAVTYTSLGVAASLTGAAFGAAAQKPGFLIPAALFFVVLAISLFGAFEIQLPQSLQAKLQGSGPRRGFLGAFIMGLVLGPISAPCVGPVIGAVLLAIAQEGNVALGALKLFTFALGMGVLFVAVGTFSATLPKSGDWLIRFKRVMGLVVLAFAIWTVRLIVPMWMNVALLAILQLVGAAAFGVFEPADSFLAQIRRGFAVILLVLSVLHWVKAAEMISGVPLLPGAQARTEAPKASQAFLEQDFEGALAKAKAGGKLVLVDTYADWCAQCKELDEKTWPDAAVAGWIKDNAVAVRINTDTLRKDLAPRLGIRSYPTVILLDAEGKELRRSMGFQEPKEMLAFLRQ